MKLLRVDWEKLKLIELRLRLYVHGWNPDDWQDVIDSEKDKIYECPNSHGHKLALAYSFAWTLADRLQTIIQLKCELAVEDLLKETLMIYATFKRHKEDYPFLFQTMKEIYRACHQKE